MSYRPITDVWLLARSKLKGGQKYYGSYPAGFLSRARALLGVTIDDPVLHVCSGMVQHYPYAGFGANDCTLDLDPMLCPDHLQSANDPYPRGFKAVMADPPYSPEDAERYAPGADAYPKPDRILINALNALKVGQRVGILHYVAPRPPKNTTRLVALIAVMVGFKNRVRIYSVFEKLPAVVERP